MIKTKKDFAMALLFVGAILFSIFIVASFFTTNFGIFILGVLGGLALVCGTMTLYDTVKHN